MKDLRIVSAEIRVNANPYCGRGLFADLRVTGVFPGCRKAQTVSFSPGARVIHARPLFGYNGHAALNPRQFSEFVEFLPVTSDKHAPVTVTPEIESWARLECTSIATCPAVRDSEAHFSYLASLKYDGLDVNFYRLPGGAL